MDTTSVTIEVDETSVHHHLSSRNPICINVVKQTQRFTTDESKETKSCSNQEKSLLSQIKLDLHNYEFSPSYLFSLIDPHLRSPQVSGRIANEMASWAIQHTGVIRKPYRMFVNAVSTDNVSATVPVSCRSEKETQKEEEDESTCAVCSEKETRKEQEEESTCAICLEEFVKGKKMELLLNCSHRFHLRCIGEWLQSRNSCPLCRQKLFE